MRISKGLLRGLAEPVVGAIFIVYFGFAGIGRIQGDFGAQAGSWCPLIALGIAIGLSRLQPWAATTLTIAVVVSQLLVPLIRFDQNSWPAYVGIALVGIGLGSTRSKLARRLGLPGLVIAGLGASWLVLDTRLGIGLVARLGEPDDRLTIELIAGGIAAVIVVGSWLIGHIVKAFDDTTLIAEARDRAEADLAAAEAELRAISEKERIAQDVHDIMAHSLSVIVAQADGARFLAEARGESFADALEAIARSARESLAEVRMLIDSLESEPEGHSLPTLDDIPALIDRMVDGGVRVRLQQSGTVMGLTKAQEMSVYRIVQEGLTNSLKHADSTRPTDVELRWDGSGLNLRIATQGSAKRAVQGGQRRGLIGMRERAVMAGGVLEAKPDPATGGFVITAFLPSPEPLDAAAQLSTEILP